MTMSDAAPLSRPSLGARLLREATNPSSRWTVFALLAAVCLAIYVPGLGLPELRGEEERRVLPGLEMIHSGNWVQPMIGGEPYHTKPPLVNWVVAASVLVTGTVNEWTVRLPSVLAMLGFLAVLSLLPCRALSNRARLFGGIVFLTNLGMLEKGRLIEMEALLVGITGAACLWWMMLRIEGRSAWLVWSVPCLLLAAGMLLKGPVIPVFFYAFIGCALLAERRVHALFHPAHLLGAAAAAGLFYAWFTMSSDQQTTSNVSHGLASEAFARFRVMNFGWPRWFTMAGLALANFLPWIAFIPLVWRRGAFGDVDDRTRRILVGSLWGATIGFLLVALAPGTSARYSMPAFPMLAVLLGAALDALPSTAVERRLGATAVLAGLVVIAGANLAGAILIAPTLVGCLVAVVSLAVAGVAIHRRAEFGSRVARMWGTVAVAVLGAFAYGTFYATVLANNEKYRPAAVALDAAVPEGDTIYVYKPWAQEFIFYLDRPVDYAIEPTDVTNDVRYLVVKRSDLTMLEEGGVLRGREVDELLPLNPRIEGDFRLVRLGPERIATAGDESTVPR